jgi:hypothetical protein
MHDALLKDVVKPVPEASELFNRLAKIEHLMSVEDQQGMVLSQEAKAELVLACECSLHLHLLALPCTHSLLCTSSSHFIILQLTLN